MTDKSESGADSVAHSSTYILPRVIHHLFKRITVRHLLILDNILGKYSKVETDKHIWQYEITYNWINLQNTPVWKYQINNIEPLSCFKSSHTVYTNERFCAFVESHET